MQNPEFETNQEVQLPLYSSHIPAGFPSPAEDFLEKRLDLNDYLIRNRSATFLIKVTGTSMQNAGISDGDLLIVDRSVTPADGMIILGVLNGEFTVKKLRKRGKKILLIAENDQFEPIEIQDETDFKVWGVVTFAIHKL